MLKERHILQTGRYSAERRFAAGAWPASPTGPTEELRLAASRRRSRSPIASAGRCNSAQRA